MKDSSQPKPLTREDLLDVLEEATHAQLRAIRLLRGSKRGRPKGPASPLSSIDIVVDILTKEKGALHLEEILRGSRSEGVRELVAKNRQRALEFSLARSWADQAPGPARIAAGDFNTPPQSNLMREFWSDYANCFGVAGLGFGYTKHTRRIRVRIDHVLAGPGWKCQAAWVTHWPGPDHDPVIADLRWTGAGTR